MNKTEKQSANILKRSRRLTMKFHLSGETHDNRTVYLFLGGFVMLEISNSAILIGMYCRFLGAEKKETVIWDSCNQSRSFYNFKRTDQRNCTIFKQQTTLSMGLPA